MDFLFHWNGVFPPLSVICALFAVAAIAGMIRLYRVNRMAFSALFISDVPQTLNGRWSVI